MALIVSAKNEDKLTTSLCAVLDALAALAATLTKMAALENQRLEQEVKN